MSPPCDCMKRSAHARELRRNAVDVAAQDGGEVGVDHGRLAAADELRQRAHLGRDRDLREPRGARQLGHAPLVRGAAVAVQQGDRHGPVAGAAGFVQPAPRLLLVQLPHHGPVGAHAFVNLKHAFVHRCRQADVEGEDVGAVLVADAQRVAEAAGGHQQRWARRAVRAARWWPRWCPCAPRRPGGRDRLAGRQAEQLAHALHGRVGVARGVLREQLAVTSAPSGRRATTSVKVPPRSIQKRQPLTAEARSGGAGAGGG